MMGSVAQRRIVRMLSLFLIHSTVVLLSGCMAATSTHRRLDLSCMDLSDQVEQAQRSGSFKEAECLCENWWEFFGDTQLNCFIETTLAFHPTREVAQARIGLAYEKSLEVRSALLPYVDLFTSFTRKRQSEYAVGIPGFIPFVLDQNPWFNTATALINATYELDVWGKNQNLYNASLGALQQEITDEALSCLVLSTAVAQAYFSYQSHLRQYQIMGAIVARRERLQDLLMQRFDSGMGNALVVYQSDSDVATAKNYRDGLGGLLEQDRHALASLVGNVEGIPMEIMPVKGTYEAVPLPTCLPIDLLIRRPDILRALWKIETMGYGIKAAKARFLPSFDLFGSFGNVSFLVAQLFTHPAQSIIGVGSGTLPLYTGGELSAQLGQAQYAFDMAIEQYNETILRAVEEVSKALTQIQASDAQWAQLLRAVKDQEQLTCLHQQRYEQGVGTQLALLQEEIALFNEEVLAEQMGLNRLGGIVSLMRALGGGYYGR